MFPLETVEHLHLNLLFHPFSDAHLLLEVRPPFIVSLSLSKQLIASVQGRSHVLLGLASYFTYLNDFVGHRVCDIDGTGETVSGFWDFPLAQKLLPLKKIGLSSSAREKNSEAESRSDNKTLVWDIFLKRCDSFKSAHQTSSRLAQIPGASGQKE